MRSTTRIAAGAELVPDLVLANRLLVQQGVLDGFGHVSARDPQQPGRFFIARSMAPATVAAADILSCDLDGEVIDDQGRKTYLERFIHSEIYRVRPDVMAIVHSHSPALIPFGVTGARLRPVCHMSGFLGAATPVFEIRMAAGENTDMLVRNQALGRALARTLGGHAVALMRGHGSVAVGSSVRQAVFRAVYTESNARLQAQALALGPVEYLSDGEAKAASDMNDGQLDRPWQVWVQELAAAGLRPPDPESPDAVAAR